MRKIMRYAFLVIAVSFLSSTLDAQTAKANIIHQKKETAKALKPGINPRNPFKNKTSSALEGEKLFVHNCATCHGDKGLGNGPASVGLIPKPDNLTSEEIHKQSDGALFLGISKGAHGDMIAWKFVLSDNQRWHLVDYIRELRAKSK